MGQRARLEKQYHDQNFAMAPGSYTTHRNPRVNTPVDLVGELDELASASGPAKKSNAGSEKAHIKASIFLEAPTQPLVPLTSENLFIKFMKMFMEITQA